MNFYERYISGETKSVYGEIQSLGQDAFSSRNLPEIEKVLDETFRRCAINLEIIHHELQRVGYRLKTDFRYSSDNPLLKPLPETDALLKTLDKAVAPLGFVPISLKKFYRIVGSCDFGWDYEVEEDFFWEYADPIQISSLDDLVSYTTGEDWLEEMQEYVDEDLEPAYLELAADYLHKDNVSGGLPYCLEITKKPSIDGLFLNEKHKTTFIDYLRICFENCGFSNIEKNDIKNDYQSFFSRVKPQMLEI